MSEEEIRAHERRLIADRFRALAARCRAVPDEGLTIGEIHQNREQAVANDRIADMIEGEARDSR
jgi:hypothetical protein